MVITLVWSGWAVCKRCKNTEPVFGYQAHDDQDVHDFLCEAHLASIISKCQVQLIDQTVSV